MEDYIVPSKDNVVFKAECDYFGYIERNVYKMHSCGNCLSNTFATSFEDAVNELHKWIKEEKHLLDEFPKAKFNIYAIDGSLDKYGDAKHIKVYTISSSKAKKYLIK